MRTRRSPPPPAAVAGTAATADARSDRAVALAMVALSIAAAISYGTPRAVAIAGAWGTVSAVAAAAASARWYRGPTRATVAAALRVAYSAALQLFVASGRRAPVTIASHTGFWASRVGPVVVFLYAVTARLPRRAHRTVAIASALIAAILQPAACTSISACYPGIDGVMAAMVAAGARAVAAVVGAVTGVHIIREPDPCPARTCFLVMTWLFWVALLAADVLAHAQSRVQSRAQSRAAPRAIVRIALRSAAAWAALVAADVVTPCTPLPEIGGVGAPLCAGGAVVPPIKRLLRGGGG